MAQAPATEMARIGSMSIFWPLIEPILTGLGAHRICEIGMASGAFTSRLVAWGREHDCACVGIDPTFALEAAGWLTEGFTGCLKLHRHRSLEVLPTLEPCAAYFLDGDHNFYTVRRELELIERAALLRGKERAAPIVFVHDVGWPWGRRDMYYLPSTVPAEYRHPWSETRGVPLDGEDLVDGGMREPGKYAIALEAGGPQNGVLSAVEDFLSGPAGREWTSFVLPVAYGLAVLYQPKDPLLPEEGQRQIDALQAMAATGADFFQTCERNYLQLFLYGEYTQHLANTTAEALRREGAAHQTARKACEDLRTQIASLTTNRPARSFVTRCKRLLSTLLACR